MDITQFSYTTNKIMKLSLDASGISRENSYANCLTLPGEVGYFATINPPTGWFLCDGSSFDQNIYYDLSMSINGKFGFDSDNKMNLPDLTDRFIRCDNGNSLNSRNLCTLQEDSIKEHNHEISGGMHTHNTTKRSNTTPHDHTVKFKQSWSTSLGTDSLAHNGNVNIDYSNSSNENWTFPRGGYDEQMTSDPLDVNWKHFDDDGNSNTGLTQHQKEEQGDHDHHITYIEQALPYNLDQTGDNGVSAVDADTRPKNNSLIICIKY